MPPPKKFNGSVILYDARLSGDLAAEARSCVSNICAHKFFNNFHDVTHVVIFNSSHTNNHLVGQFGTRNVFQNIDVVTYDSAVKFEPNFVLSTIDTAKAAVDGNWFEPLLVAVDLTKGFCETPGNESNQIICLTDLATAIPKIRKKLMQHFKRMCELTRCNVVVGGPRCKTPSRLNSPFFLTKWKKTLELVDDNPNYLMARELSQISNTFFCNFKLAQHLFLGLRYHQMQPWNVPLTVGTKLMFCVQTSRIMKECTLKMRQNTDQVIEETWVLAEDGTVTVPFINVISGVLMHEKYVPLPQEVCDSFKLIGNASFKVVCFISQDSIPDVYLGSDATYVSEHNPKANKISRRLLRVLHSVLEKSRLCMIARRVYRKNCAPTLLALLPNVKKGTFLVHKLPFRDRIQVRYDEEDLNAATKPAVPEEKDNLISDYLGSLDITDTNCVLRTSNNGSAFPVLSANCALSYNLQAVCQRALKKYTTDEIPEGCCDPTREFLDPVCNIPPALENLFQTKF